jgi:DNA modification methylase
MFSFVGDQVLDPFAGTNSTMIAAMRAKRNSIGNEIDPHYLDLAETRIRRELANPSLFEVSPQLTIQR